MQLRPGEHFTITGKCGAVLDKHPCLARDLGVCEQQPWVVGHLHMQTSSPQVVSWMLGMEAGVLQPLVQARAKLHLQGLHYLHGQESHWAGLPATIPQEPTRSYHEAWQSFLSACKNFLGQQTISSSIILQLQVLGLHRELGGAGVVQIYVQGTQQSG